MKQKYISRIAITCFLLLLTTFIPNVNADPAIMIYDYTLSPEVFMPGDNGILTLTIKNGETTSTVTKTTTSGTSTTVSTDTVGATIENVWIEATNSGGNQIYATLSHGHIGELAPGASFDISFELVTNDGISEGVYFPTVHVDVEESRYEDVSFPIPLRISNESVYLIEDEVPSKLSMSGSTDITLTAINRRETSVDGVIVTPRELDDVEYTPKSFFIGELESDASQDITFSVKPTGIGTKNLSFVISYKNGENVHDETLTLSLEVIETLDVAPVFTSILSSINKGNSARINLEVYNAKTDSISGVIVTPITGATIIPSQYFIGTMDPDDVFSASFNLYTNNLDYGNHSIKFKVSFKQGNDYYETPTITNSFSVVEEGGVSYQPSSSANDESQRGPPGEGLLVTCLLFIAMIIIIIVVFLFWRWKKRRNVK